MALFGFRRLLEENNLTERICTAINTVLAAKGLLLREGTVVDVTIIETPSSTKGKDGARDLEMYQAKKGNQWCSEMKTHIGVEADSGLITTAANMSDITQAQALLQGDETRAFGYAGYQGVEKRQQIRRSVKWHAALRPGKRLALRDTKPGRMRKQPEELKARVRAKVEDPFHVARNIFGQKKDRDCGLAENTAQLHKHFYLANMMIARGGLFELQAQGAS